MAVAVDMEPSVVLDMHEVTKTYHMGDTEVHALWQVNFVLFASELVVLLGLSGSGKSTLLNILGGLDVPTRSRVMFRDFDLTAANDRERTWFRRQVVGSVFQFYHLIPSLTARENVALVTDIASHAMPPAEALTRGTGGAARPFSGSTLRRRATAGSDCARYCQTSITALMR
jgi:putative ABC transport system ATP-binding protein